MPDAVDLLVADIDELIDDALARGECDGVGQADCALCGGDWHGAPADADTAREHRRIPHCPGASATDAQREQWLASDHTVDLTGDDLEKIHARIRDLQEFCQRVRDELRRP